MTERHEFEDAETGDELVLKDYTEYKVVQSFVGLSDTRELIWTHRVEVYSQIIWAHFDVLCEAGEECTHYDAEAGNAWWDTVPEIASGEAWNVATAVAAHLAVCTGPLRVKSVIKDDD